MPQQTEIIATPTFQRTRFDNGLGRQAVAVFTALIDQDGRQIERGIKGPVDDESHEPRIRVPYRFYGHWTTYTNPRTGRAERQFQFSSFVRSAQPKGRSAVVAYLSQAPHVGRVTATHLWDLYGEDSVERLRESADQVARAVRNLSIDHALEASAWLESNQKLEETMIELTGLFDRRGLPRNTARLAVREWGNRAFQIVSANPHALMRFPGVGFKRADAMYLELGLPPARLKRQALACQYGVRSSGGGDTWHYNAVAKHAVYQAISGADTAPAKAVRLAVRAGLLASQYTDGKDGPIDPFGSFYWLADANQAKTERKLAVRAAGLMQQPSLYGEARTQLDWNKLSSHQAEQLQSATINGSSLGVLCGSPGTGKTYTIAQLAKAIRRKFGAGQLAIAAPTGKAAVRCTEAMSENGLELTARTIHSLLGVDGISGGFAHNRHNPLPYMFVIVDEASMVDTDLMQSLLDAVPAGSHVLLVGDVNQLLPVGHGAPLRDLIAAGVPTGELTEIKRNSGGIVEACAAIRDGLRFEVGDNLVSRTGDDAAAVVLEAARHSNVDPTWGVQVVTAINRNSPLCRKQLNEELQQSLNPNRSVPGCPFRLGDKVICTKNSWLQLVGPPGPGVISRDDGRAYCANGEIGRVTEVQAKLMKVELSAPQRVLWAPLGRADDGESRSDFDLAYAISVHKSQGSEFPVVIVCLDDSPSANRVGDRAWVYTAISRAKQRCVLWGDLQTAHRWVRKDRMFQRKTFLRELVEERSAAPTT
ncbi:MAG: AAA family ATPase [Planctomycetota bacterium]